MTKLALRCAVALTILATAGTARAQDHPKNKWAFLVGIGNYPRGKPLPFAANDMTGLKEAMCQHLGLVDDNVVLLTDRAASYDAITKGFKNLVSHVGAGDLVLFAFSGHGSSAGDQEDDRKSYLLPYDFLTETGEERLISLTDHVYNPLKTRKDVPYKMVIIDACRNDPKKGKAPLVPGGILKARDNDILLELERNRASGRSQAFELEYPPKGIFALASCTDDQFSWEDNTLGHGVFMNFIIEGISGKAAREDGMLSALELFNYSREHTIDHLKDQVARDPRTTQTPYEKSNTPVYPVLGQPGKVGVIAFQGKDVSEGSALHQKFMEHARKYGLDTADLTRTTMNNLKLKGVSLTGARLIEARLVGTDLTEADLTSADLTGANASNAVFRGAVAVGADFTRANLTGADFDHADTRGAIFATDTSVARNLRIKGR
jgi:uncharacterized protein YjbI with pentapeptide repeats